MPVYIRINLRKFRDKRSGVLDTRIFNYKNTFGFDFLTKEEALNTHDIYPHHCMSICGVNLLEHNKPQRWKLEDSYGTLEKVDGYYIMNDNYFDEFILQAIINKKYLSKKQRELLKQDVIEFEIKDPFQKQRQCQLTLPLLFALLIEFLSKYLKLDQQKNSLSMR